jgi:pimeloyl-ACP methyl ester carboxylesterase
MDAVRHIGQAPDSSYTTTWSHGRGEVNFLTLSNGSRVRYLKTGAGPPLVLLHTVRTQLDYFQLVIPRIWDSFTVYALDLPGMGWSDITKGASYEEPDLRSSIVEFVTALGLDGITLAGESMGATLALSASIDLGDKVGRVVAFNTYDYPEGIERGNRLARLIVVGERIPLAGSLLAHMESKPILRGVMRGGFADKRKLPEDFLTELRRVGRRAGYPRVARAVFRSLNSLIAARERYRLIQAPVVLVYGDGDWSRPSDREGVERLLSDAKSVILPRTGHFSALEQPVEMARILLDLVCLSPDRETANVYQCFCNEDESRHAESDS